MTMTRSSSQAKQETIEGVRKILDQKLQAYRRFLSMTELLRGNIAAQALEETEAIIARRQDCITRIEHLDHKMEVLTLGIPDIRKDEIRNSMGSSIAEIRNILQTILSADKSLTGTLAGYCGTVQGQLMALTARKNNFQGCRSGNDHNARILNLQT
jgi:hypothetical protein